MPTDSESDSRDELKKLGARRKKLEADRAKLATDTQDALNRSYGSVPVAEAARLLHMHRTTVYRVYEPHEQNAA